MSNALGKGCQINLDNGEGRILDGYVIDDIFAISSYLAITFECKDKLLFGADNGYYFTYMKIDWVPLTLNECTGLNGTWHYDLTCVPSCVFELLKKPAKNTGELASALKLNLSSVSSSLELPCSIVNQYAGNVILDSRLFSFEQAYNDRDFSNAIYIYVSSKELFSTTWKSLTSQTALTLTFPKGTEGSNLVTYQDYQFDSIYTTASGAQVWKQKDYIGKLLGTQFKVETTIPAVCFNVYTIKLEDIPEFDTGLPFLCTYSKRNIMETNAFIHYFTNIKYMG